MNKNEDERQGLLKAKNTVFRLLNFRERSEKEIRDKLKTKSISSKTTDQCIKYFKELSLVDDRQFAQKWINYRLSKPFGINRIRLELKQKGISPEILEETLTQAQENFNEFDIVLELSQRRLEKYKNIDTNKAKQRLYGYLSRRGFSTSSIKKTLIELFNNYDDNK